MMALLVCNLGNSLGEVRNWPLYVEGKKRPRFKKQGNLPRRLVMGGHKTGVSPPLPARIVKACTKSLTGRSQP